MDQNTLQQLATKLNIPVEVLQAMLSKSGNTPFTPPTNPEPWSSQPGVIQALMKKNPRLEEGEDRFGSAWDRIQNRKGGLADTFGMDGSFGREGGLIERWGGVPDATGKRQGGILSSLFGGMFGN